MPPKSLTTSTGQSCELNASAFGLVEPMIESQSPDIATTGDETTPVPLPRVDLKPQIPIVVTGDGPTLQIRQLWEGTVIEIRDEGFVATLADKTKPKSRKTIDCWYVQVPLFTG